MYFWEQALAGSMDKTKLFLMKYNRWTLESEMITFLARPIVIRHKL